MPYLSHLSYLHFWIQWLSPGEFLLSSSPDPNISTRKLKMKGPQPYELGRLCRLSTLEQLCQYNYQRAALGLERWMSVYYICSDGNLTLLNGNLNFIRDFNCSIRTCKLQFFFKWSQCLLYSKLNTITKFGLLYILSYTSS